jgi:hypothetical protein
MAIGWMSMKSPDRAPRLAHRLYLLLTPSVFLRCPPPQAHSQATNRALPSKDNPTTLTIRLPIVRSQQKITSAVGIYTMSGTISMATSVLTHNNISMNELVDGIHLTDRRRLQIPTRVQRILRTPATYTVDRLETRVTCRLGSNPPDFKWKTTDDAITSDTNTRRTANLNDESIMRDPIPAFEMITTFTLIVRTITNNRAPVQIDTATALENNLILRMGRVTYLLLHIAGLNITASEALMRNDRQRGLYLLHGTFSRVQVPQSIQRQGTVGPTRRKVAIRPRDHIVLVNDSSVQALS